MADLEQALVELQRRRQLAVRARLVAQLALLWPALDPERLDDTFLAWALAVTTAVEAHRALSAAVAAQFVTALRQVAGAPGEAVVAPVVPVDRDRMLQALAIAGPVTAKRSMAAGVPLKDAMVSAFAQSTERAARVALAGGRETVMATVAADPAARGWRRVNGNPDCRYCRDRVGRVLTTTEFGAHKFCSCSAAPVFSSEHAA